GGMPIGDNDGLERLHGRLEALLINIGDQAWQLSALIGATTDRSANLIEKVDHLASLTRTNPALAEIERLAGEARRLILIYESNRQTTREIIQQLIEGALAVIG